MRSSKLVILSVAKDLLFAGLTATLCIAIASGCKSPAPPSTPQPTHTATYPPRPTVAPTPFHLFHQTTDSLTLVTTPDATDAQIAAILYQLHDAARAHTFAALHLPQSFIDHRAPIVFFHIYRGPQCAAEKYADKLPCGAAYHAAGDYTLGSFHNPDRDDAALLHDEDHQTELWNPDAPAAASTTAPR